MKRHCSGCGGTAPLPCWLGGHVPPVPPPRGRFLRLCGWLLIQHMKSSAVTWILLWNAQRVVINRLSSQHKTATYKTTSSASSLKCFEMSQHFRGHREFKGQTSGDCILAEMANVVSRMNNDMRRFVCQLKRLTLQYCNAKPVGAARR